MFNNLLSSLSSLSLQSVTSAFSDYSSFNFTKKNRSHKVADPSYHQTQKSAPVKLRQVLSTHTLDLIPSRLLRKILKHSTITSLVLMRSHWLQSCKQIKGDERKEQE